LTLDSLDDEFHLEWLTSFYDHGRFLARHLEHYSSPYNHLVGEAAALFALGLSFPEFTESRQWCDRAQKVLETRLAEQFYADGGSVEQSFFYHHATTGFYLLAILIGRANRRELSRDVWAAVERGINFSMQIVQPNGRIPEVGGADDGKPIRLEHLPFWDFRPYQAMGAVIFNRADFKSVAGRFYEDALWLLGPEGLDIFNLMPVQAPRGTHVALAASGYFIERTGWEDTADYVCFDVGEQAAGMRPDAIPNSMHGHADCLSVIACLGGKRVLVDSGLYAYNCGGVWEAHFRETAAHSTARIDARDQARHIGKMAWSHSYRARVDARSKDDFEQWTIGSHDGYARGADGVTHRRAVWLRPGGYFLIYDQFDARGQHAYELNLQFAPGALSLENDSFARFNDDIDIAWLTSGDWTADVRCGGPGPGDGWICPSLGVRVPAPRLTLRTLSSATTLAVLTVIVNRRVAAVARRDNAVARRGDGLLCVEGHDWRDWVAGVGIYSGTGIKTDGLVGICRVASTGDVIHQQHAGGTMVHVDPTQLARHEQAMDPLIRHAK
jgi:hypothetical protein